MNKTIDKLVKGGAIVGTYGVVLTALIAAGYADPALATKLALFMGGVGSNVVAAILDRAAQGKQPTNKEIEALLAVIRESTGANTELLEDLLSRFKADIGAGLDMIAEHCTDSSADLVEIKEMIRDMDADSADRLERMERIQRRILQCLEPPAPSAREQHETLMEYVQAVLSSPRHTRLSTGGLTAESACVLDSVREPQLDDIFVEPNLTGAGSLRASRERVAELLGTVQEEDSPSADRDKARAQLLRMQGETWDAIRKEGASQCATEALKEQRAAVILGDPGSGKSTLLRWVMVEGARSLLNGDRGPIPVFTAVGDFANAWLKRKKEGQSLTLRDYLRSRVETECAGMGAILSSALEEGGAGVCLLLDGLDEVPRDLRRSVVPSIHEFIVQESRASRPTKVLVSSRFFGYEEAPIAEPAVQLVVMPFDDDQIRTFARRWYLGAEKHLQRDRSNEAEADAHAHLFEESVFARPQITELARNPLMLTMIAVVIRQGKRLPERRVELYDLTLRQLMTQWEFLRGETGEHAGFRIDYNEACQLWAPVARWMHEVGTGAVHEAELKQRLAKRIDELELDHKAEEWLAVRGDKCCLLQERGSHIFGFLHQTFQEYLAAMDILHEGEFVEELPRYIEDPRWHEVLRLACGYLGVVCVPPNKKEVTQLLRSILDNGSSFEHLLHRDLFLAASCIADDVKPRKEMEQDIVARLLAVAASDELDAVREQAMELAVRNAAIPVSDSVWHPLGCRLAKASSIVIQRSFAEWLAGRTGEYSEALLLDIWNNSDSLVGISAAHLWKRNRDHQLRHDLLFNIPRPGPVAERIREVLRQDIPGLVRLLPSARDRVRLKIAYVLLNTDRHDKAVAALVPILRSDRYSRAIDAAQMLLDTQARGLALSCLVNNLGHHHEHARYRSARLLAETGFRDLAQHGWRTCLNVKEQFVRRLSACALIESEYRQQAVTVLESILEHGHGYDRYVAATSLLSQEAHVAAWCALEEMAAGGLDLISCWSTRKLSEIDVTHLSVEALAMRIARDPDLSGRRRAAQWAYFPSHHPARALFVQALEHEIGSELEDVRPDSQLYEAAYLYASHVTDTWAML